MTEPAVTAVEPTGAQLATLASSTDEGPVVMLNLLRYRDLADDDTGRTGRQAYADYSAVAVRLVLEHGGGFEFMGTASPSLIAPAGEQWDDVVLVRYPNRAAFLAMVSCEEYQANMHHRTVALADSRLIPMTKVEL